MPYFQMTRLALKWAFAKPVTNRYPFESRQPLPGSRGTLEFDKATCVFCTVCAKKCPTGALTVHRPSKRWSIDPLLCIACGACVEACPKKSITLATAHPSPTRTKNRRHF